MPPEIRRLAELFLMNPKEISVSKPSTLGESITQNLILIEHKSKRDLNGLQKKKRDLLRKLIELEEVKNALVFCNRKKDVDILNKSFLKHGLNSATLHGDMSQSSRMDTMRKFKEKSVDFLVCSDVAARGLDIDNLSHVFNFDIPTHPEDYVHRIGRTGRAGKLGRAFSLGWKEDKKYIEAIEALTQKKIPIMQIDTANSNDTGSLGNLDNIKTKTKPNVSNSPFSEEQLESWSGHIPAFLGDLKN